MRLIGAPLLESRDHVAAPVTAWSARGSGWSSAFRLADKIRTAQPCGYRST